ncbi:hypothetical protein L2E82_52448 [Cichorium intybus]|nr:hypothetical protein L2E82_52448 [Cichorium intybus]
MTTEHANKANSENRLLSQPRTKTPHAPFTPRKYPDNESQRPSNGQWGKVDELGQSPCPYLLQALKAKKSTRKAKKATSSLANDDEVHRRLRSSTPGSPGSTTVGPNHSQKKSLILAQKER